jgi:hypothetical protein
MKECLPTTRVEILEEIKQWVGPLAPNTPRGSQRAFLLLGQAGTGKSSIAGSVASFFRERRQLGSAFCFQAKRGFDDFIPTIARDLADQYPAFRDRLANAICDSTSVRRSRDLLSQFEHLLEKPLSDLAFPDPVVIIIDALDESAEPGFTSRSRLLSFLRNKLSKFPPTFRFFMTSRRERDVMDGLVASCRDLVTVKYMDDVTMTDGDIRKYVRHQLRLHDDDREVLDDSDENLLDGFTCHDVDQIVRAAEGVFQFAFLCCSKIRHTQAGDVRMPKDWFTEIMTSIRTAKRDGGVYLLDTLYMTILRGLYHDPKSLHPQIARFQTVMGLILASGEPLLRTILAKLGQWKQGSGEQNVAAVIDHMGSLLTGLDDDSQAVQPCHSSFRDFLLEESRSKEFHVDMADAHQSLLLSCFNIMNTSLSFNISGFPTSYLRNHNVPEQLRPIPLELSYACRMWPLHLMADQIEITSTLAWLTTFLEEKFLFWLEVISILHCLHVAIKALSSLLNWAQVCSKVHTGRRI